MKDVWLRWIGTDPLHYRAIAWGAFALLAALAAARSWRPSWWNPGLGWALLVGATLLAFRWPDLLYDAPLHNPDESQLLAGALTFRHDPIPFRSVDGNTSGPLNAHALLAFCRLTGLAIDFPAARLFHLLCCAAASIFLWRTLRSFVDSGPARVLTLPTVAAFSTGFDFDLIQLNTEPLPVALVAAAVWALAPGLDDAKRWPAWRIALVGLLAGAAPLAKPQAAPLTAVVGAGAIWMILVRADFAGGRLGRLAGLAAGAAAPTALLFAACAWGGALADAYQSFIANNLAYTGSVPTTWAEAVRGVWQDACSVGSIELVLWSAGLAVIVAPVAGWCEPPERRRLLVLALLLGAAACFAVVAPRRAFVHYLTFLPVPLGLLGAAVTLALLPAPATGGQRPPWATRAVWALWVAAALLPFPLARGHAVSWSLERLHIVNDDRLRIASLAIATATRDEPIAVWGWMPSFYVYAQRRQAAREAITQRQIEAWGDREYYRRRFVADLVRANPPLFIDGTGPESFAYGDRLRHGFESFPALADWVVARYVPVDETTRGRFLVRRDRATLPRPALPELAGVAPAPEANYLRPVRPIRLGNEPAVSAHAPCWLTWRLPPGRHRLGFSFGMVPGCYGPEGSTDGVVFRVRVVDPAGRGQDVFARTLQPKTVEADRGEFHGEMEIEGESTLVLVTDPGPAGHDGWDWSYWRNIRITPATGP